MKRRNLLGFLLAGLFLMAPYLARADDVPDTYGNRLAAAERYLQVVSMKDMMKDMVTATAKNLPQKAVGPYIALMTKQIRVEALERAALAAMAKNFTVGELNALADFYGSKEGRSAVKKFGTYMADVLPVLEQEMERAGKEIQPEVERMLKQ